MGREKWLFRPIFIPFLSQSSPIFVFNSGSCPYVFHPDLSMIPCPPPSRPLCPSLCMFLCASPAFSPSSCLSVPPLLLFPHASLVPAGPKSSQELYVLTLVQSLLFFSMVSSAGLSEELTVAVAVLSLFGSCIPPRVVHGGTVGAAPQAVPRCSKILLRCYGGRPSLCPCCAQIQPFGTPNQIQMHRDRSIGHRKCLVVHQSPSFSNGDVLIPWESVPWCVLGGILLRVLYIH